MNKVFTDVNSVFEQRFSGLLSARWPTMKAFLNLASSGLPGAPISILETGCQRMLDDWGGGCSTWIFGEFLNTYVDRGVLVSVDIDAQNLKIAEYVLTTNFGKPEDRNFTAKLINADSISTLGELSFLPSAIDTRFDIIYLDSMDCDPRIPEGEEQTKASQLHQLNEAKVAVKLFSDKLPFKVLMLDDNNLPWGGKCKLTKEWLNSEFWTCLYDYQQSLWIKTNENFQIW